MSVDWSTAQIEIRSRDVEDVGAGDVGRHEVRRKLDATEAGVDDTRQRFNRQRFRRSGHAFDQRMSFRQQSDQNLFDRIVLSDDDFSEFSANVFDCGGDGLRH